MHTRGLIQSEEICADMAETYKNTPIITHEFHILVCALCIYEMCVRESMCVMCACD